MLDAARTEQLSPTVLLERLLALEDLDYDASPALEGALINDLASLRFIEQASNVLLVGPPGVGKTHIAVGLARKAAEAGYRTYFTTAVDLAARCHRAAIEGRWATTMRFFAGPTLLVIDLCRHRDYAEEPAVPVLKPLGCRSSAP